MPRGRCPGCGTEDASAKKVERHMTACQDYVALYRAGDPKAMLSAEECAAQQKALESTDEYREAKEAAKDELYAGYRARNEHKVEAGKERWSGKSTQFRQLHAKSHAVSTPANGRLTVTTSVAGDPGSAVASRQEEIRLSENTRLGELAPSAAESV